MTISNIIDILNEKIICRTILEEHFYVYISFRYFVI